MTYLTGTPDRCPRCNTTDHQIVSFGAATRDSRLYVSDGHPSAPTAGLVYLCRKCKAEWMQFQAVLGYDLHTHFSEVVCSDACFSKNGGRSAQRLSTVVFFRDSKKGFWVNKAIDGMPNVNACAQRIALRSFKFLFGRWDYCYAPIMSVDHLIEGVLANDRLRSFGIPLAMVPHYSVIFEAFESAYTAPRGRLVEPASGDNSIGPHCVGFVGCDDEGSLLDFWNNWGTNWGVRGHGSVSADYVRKFFQEGWVTWFARYGPHPFKRPAKLESSDPRTVRREWTIENWRFLQPLRGCRPGNSWSLEAFVTTSPSDGREMQVLQIRNGIGQRMGWAFMCASEEGRVSQIRELFVMPAFRKQGIGSYLEGIASHEASEVGFEEIHIILNNCDTVLGPIRKTARDFATKRGYSWRWRQIPELGADGFAIKRLDSVSAEGGARRTA